MKITSRLDTAVQKLYTAFHRNALHPECCTQCAVGTLLDGSDRWKHLTNCHGSFQLNYIGRVHEMLGKRFEGYLPSELLQIEFAFLQGCGYQLPFHYAHDAPANPKDKEVLFDGLCATMEVLFKLEGIETNFNPWTIDSYLNTVSILNKEHRIEYSQTSIKPVL